MNKFNERVIELLGTFILLFFGTAPMFLIEASSGSTLVNAGVAVTFGVLICVLINGIGRVSGAHLNPAVTLGFWAAGRFPGRQVLPYVLSQCSGAILASLILYLLFRENLVLAVTMPAGPDGQAFFCEMAMTSLLMFVILNITTGYKIEGVLASVVIGLLITVETLMAIPVSGASMNPARSLGPALVIIELDKLWIYLAAPTLGAFLAVAVCKSVRWNGCCSPKKLEKSNSL